MQHSSPIHSADVLYLHFGGGGVGDGGTESNGHNSFESLEMNGFKPSVDESNNNTENPRMRHFLICLSCDPTKGWDLVAPCSHHYKEANRRFFPAQNTAVCQHRFNPFKTAFILSPVRPKPSQAYVVACSSCVFSTCNVRCGSKEASIRELGTMRKAVLFVLRPAVWMSSRFSNRCMLLRQRFADGCHQLHAISYRCKPCLCLS